MRYLLGNEKYIGDALLQKTFVTDTFPFDKTMNRGQRQKFYVENTHPAIIDRETFEKTQELLKKRLPYTYNGFNEYPLSKKMICGHCGSTFKRRESKSVYVCWVCMEHDKDKTLCPVGRIGELEIYAAFIRLYNKLKKHYEIILTPALDELKELTNALHRENPQMQELNKAVAVLNEQTLVLNRLRTKGFVTPQAYIENEQ